MPTPLPPKDEPIPPDAFRVLVRTILFLYGLEMAIMNAFDQLLALPGLRSLFDLAWRTFGVNPALASMDGQRVIIFDKEARAQPFCGALQAYPGGPQLCAMC